MAPKLFITGATGYIGGSVFATLVKRHPEYETKLLLRKTPADFASKYPNVAVIQGDYDSADLLSKAASEADIVVHCGNSDHVKSLKAIIDGMLKKEDKGFLIHLSGTGILSDFAETKKFRGYLNPKVYSDVTGIEEVISRPPGSLHQHTDIIIQETAVKHGDKFKAAIVCPPDLYGKGCGPGRTASVYIPAFLNDIKTIGAPFYMNEGANKRGWVHIDDLMDLYTALVEAAVAGGGNVTWGKEGYFFATSQEASQKEIADATGKILYEKGIVSSPESKQVSEDVIAKTLSEFGYPDIGFYMFTSNSRAKAERAPKELGYKPKAPTLWETLEADIDDALAAEYARPGR